MIPLWMFPYAITLGNTFVLKPSERVPNTVLKIAEIMHDMGVPKGVFNVVNGGFETTKALCDHPDVRALSFVGGNNAGEYIYKRGAEKGKRM